MGKNLVLSKLRYRIWIVLPREVRTGTSKTLEDSKYSFGGDGFFDFSNEDPMNLEWMSKFLELDETLYDFP
ncbi:hypothetical protein OIU79_011707 [Salix purpurea]|uniref:Uncharacterized protein n=1 Tax=Salix purpurea TaxID=77065 RepID=A0A9Q0Q1B5_SALPP|nr:hypothetical protein OIU79_011707 [Salix purpurea]